ncbi:MAG: DUF481 domain-containing protein [Verrucomicrobiota bacterium]
MMKAQVFLVLLLLTLRVPLLHADVVTLKNGDRLSGKILEESAAGIKLESPIFGIIDIPGTAVAETAKDLEKEPEPEPPAPEETVSEHFWKEITSAIFPEGFHGEIIIGYDYSESSDVQSGVDLRLKGKYESGKHTVNAETFYVYTRKKDEDGNVSRPKDRYGLNAAYDYDIREPYFLRASNKFLVDRVKAIDLQNDINGLFGWRVFSEEDWDLDLAFGPGARYLDTTSSEGTWDPLLTFQQDSFYQFNDLVRFDQLFDYSFDPTDSSSYSLLFEVSASVRLTPFAEPKVIYRNSYDSTVGEGGIRREQSLIVALAVPF